MLYIGTFVFFAFLSYRELFMRRTKDSLFADGILTFICVAFLLVLTTIRGGEAGDYITYKEIYDGIDISKFSISSFAFEPLYSGLQWICKAIVNNFQVFLLVIGALVILLEVKYAKCFYVSSHGLTIAVGGQKNYSCEREQKRTYFFTALLIFWGLYHANIVVIRSTIALMICLYSTRYIVGKQKIKFLISVLLAFGFHYSALCFLPAYWIYYFKSKLSTKLLITFSIAIFLMIFIKDIVLLVGRIFGGLIEQKIQNYLSGGFEEGVGENLQSKGIILFAKAVLNIGFIICIGVWLWQRNKTNKFYVGTLNLYLFGCVLYLATLSVSYAFARIAIYYNIFQIPLMIFTFEGRKRTEKQWIWIVLILYLFLRMIVNLITNDTFSFVTFYD